MTLRLRLMRRQRMSGKTGQMDALTRNLPTGPRLKTLRERAELSVRELAEALGVKPSTYSDYESPKRGARPIPVWLAQGLLNVILRRGHPPIEEGEITELAGFPVVSERYSRLLDVLDHLPPEEVDAIETLILSRAPKRM